MAASSSAVKRKRPDDTSADRLSPTPSSMELETPRAAAGTGAPAVGAEIFSMRIDNLYRTCVTKPAVMEKDGFVWVKCKPGDPVHDTKENSDIHVLLQTEDLKYTPRPEHFGEFVTFINCADDSWYQRELPDPESEVWILTRESNMSSYVQRRLFETAWTRNMATRFMKTADFEIVASQDGLGHILYCGSVIQKLPDAIMCRVGAQVDYFGLAVVRQFQKLGVVVFNNAESIEISKDKLNTVQTVAAHGIAIPKTLVAKFPLNLDVIKKEFDYPIVLKKASGSQGKGVMKVDSHDQLGELADMLDTTEPLIFQEFIRASAGRDIRVFVVGGRVVCSMMRIASKGFKANVHLGASAKAVQLTSSVEWLVLETVRLIGLDIAGVDLLMDTNTYKLCEVNSSPGFKGMEAAVGINVAAKMLDYVRVRLGVFRPKEKKKKTYNIAVQSAHQA